MGTSGTISFGKGIFAGMHYDSFPDTVNKHAQPVLNKMQEFTPEEFVRLMNESAGYADPNDYLWLRGPIKSSDPKFEYEGCDYYRYVVSLDPIKPCIRRVHVD
jgi:hypothetical protein